jgi:hypothetical protein
MSTKSYISATCGIALQRSKEKKQHKGWKKCEHGNDPKTNGLAISSQNGPAVD